MDKVLVGDQYFAGVHGSLACEYCHSGDGSAQAKEKAHVGLIAYPSLQNPKAACGECHEEIVETVPRSLHATLAPFGIALRERADISKEKLAAVAQGRANHCSECHTSCGGCHVSRPRYSEGGFVNGHGFNRRPDMVNQCTACHGSRVGNEYLAKRGMGDVHASDYNMDCTSCHKAEEMHSAAPEDLKGRYHLAQSPKCEDCHKDMEHGSVREHTLHKGKVQCQVCHSQTYVNCYSCHTGIDQEGLPYYISKKSGEGFKIALNNEYGALGADYQYMVARHAPVDPHLFDFYGQDVLSQFENRPTWHRASPHNIQRRTWQSATCNHCHGNKELFLAESDMHEYEKTANKELIVPDNLIPEPLARIQEVHIDTSHVRHDMIVDASWLLKHKNDPDVLVVDAREWEEYQKYHIEGAVHYDSMSARGGVRSGWDSDKPAQLYEPERIGRVLGRLGMSRSVHIVVYGVEGWRAGFLLSVLEYMGATRISYLEGGIKTWRELGYPLSEERTSFVSRDFVPDPHPEFLVDNDYVMENVTNPEVVVVDVRSLELSNGLTKHEKAKRGGRIPGTVKVSFYGLYMDNAQMRDPKQLLFLLSEKGVTPDKTIVLTSNTGAWAGSAFFVLRYLGFPDVRVHDQSWVGWCAQYCN